MINNLLNYHKALYDAYIFKVLVLYLYLPWHHTTISTWSPHGMPWLHLISDEAEGRGENPASGREVKVQDGRADHEVGDGGDARQGSHSPVDAAACKWPINTSTSYDDEWCLHMIRSYLALWIQYFKTAGNWKLWTRETTNYKLQYSGSLPKTSQSDGMVHVDRWPRHKLCANIWETMLCVTGRELPYSRSCVIPLRSEVCDLFSLPRSHLTFLPSIR